MVVAKFVEAVVVDRQTAGKLKVGRQTDGSRRQTVDRQAFDS